MSAHELLKSRIGRRGEDGTDFIRRFFVTAPSPLPVNWHPFVDTQLIALAGLGTEFVGLKGALCRNYVVEEQHDKSHWTIIAEYGVPDTLDSGFGGGWTVDIRGNLDVAHTDVERLTDEEQNADPPQTPLVVGPFLYRRQDSLIGPFSNPQPVGSVEYTLGPPGPDALKLFTDKPFLVADRIVAGMEWYPPAMSFVCSKKFDDRNSIRTMSLASYHGFVNSKEVNLLGRAWFEPGQLMLADYHLGEVENRDPTKGLVHDVTIAFAARPDTWHNLVTHTYSDDNTLNSAHGIVWYAPNAEFDGSKPRPVVEFFRRQFTTDFNGFLESL